MKNASWEESWRLERPKLHAKSAKRKAREAVATAARASKMACRSVEKGQRLLEEAEAAGIRVGAGHVPTRDSHDGG